MSIKYNVEMIGVEHKIWIPCDAMSDEADELVNSITAEAGGVTAIVGTGVWLNSSHEFVEEEVHILSWVGHNLDEGMMSLAHLLLGQSQEAVLMEIAGDALIVTAEPEEANKYIKFSWRLDNE